MKVAALTMIMLLVFLSVIPVKAKQLTASVKENCCFKIQKQLPCNPKQHRDCNDGSCNVMQSCAACGFLKAEPITVDTLVPALAELAITPYSMGDLSDYSISNWNPPKV